MLRANAGSKRKGRTARVASSKRAKSVLPVPQDQTLSGVDVSARTNVFIPGPGAIGSSTTDPIQNEVAASEGRSMSDTGPGAVETGTCTGTTPVRVSSVTDELGYNVQQAVKDKIINSHYIDIATLLTNAPTEINK